MDYDDIKNVLNEWLSDLVNHSVIFTWDNKELYPLGNPRLADNDENGYAGTWANEDIRVVFTIRQFQQLVDGQYITTKLPKPYDTMTYNGIQYRVYSVRISSDYGGTVTVNLTRNTKPKSTGQ